MTAGAVYKWEAKLSTPELELIIQMADFFDTSVDVLLGYEMKDNSLEKTVKRLQEYRRSKDWDGLAEVEKALKKYPHSFQIVSESASLYRAFGTDSGDKALFHRALELLEQSRLLLSQNEDPQICEQTIYGRIADTYLGLGETDKAVELWKAHNAGGVYNSRIGSILAQNDQVEEAVPYLSEALANLLADLITTINPKRFCTGGSVFCRGCGRGASRTTSTESALCYSSFWQGHSTCRGRGRRRATP